MTISCLNCGICDVTLVELRAESRKKRALYLCVSCDSEYKNNYLTLEYCESCEMEFFSESDEGPRLCGTCKVYSNPMALDSTYEDYEKHGYLSSIPKKPTSTMCLQKALRLYVADRQKEDKYLLRDRAMTFFKIHKGLPDNSMVTGRMQTTARELNLKPMDYFRLMANYDRAEEGLTEIVAMYKEFGYRAFLAVEQDNQLLHLGQKPHNLAYEVKTNPPTLCLEKDDKFADLPF